jgi:hypothetical protein
MGNNAGKEKMRIEAQQQNCENNIGDAHFRSLSTDQRSITFDVRMHMPSQQRLQPRTLESSSVDFRPLQRAATYDPRLRSQKGQLTISDVMFRRYFNAREKRSTEQSTRNLFRTSEIQAEEKEAIVVVDPFSTGKTLAEKALERGYECICVYSDTLHVMKDLIKHIPKELTDKFSAIIFHNGTEEHAPKNLEDTVAALRQVQGVKIIGVIPGAETGVGLADRVSEKMKLRTNGSSGSEARRNKYHMGEKVRSAGLRAVKQRCVTKWSQIVDYIENDLRPNPFKVGILIKN